MEKYSLTLQNLEWQLQYFRMIIDNFFHKLSFYYGPWTLKLVKRRF